MSGVFEFVDDILRVLIRVDFVDQFSSTLSFEFEYFVVVLVNDWLRDDECLLLSLEQLTIRMRAPSLRATDWYFGKESLECSLSETGLILFFGFVSLERNDSLLFRLKWKVIHLQSNFVCTYSFDGWWSTRDKSLCNGDPTE